ncbi:MAG: glycosyltransferase family 9 protein [Corticimicrobacter sp.]|uniref:glycosyltransferase family 9 protein n=1 Tax=Corticimicrobacter sp. TaxID=2678536 RepID=UPI0032D9C628
MSLPSLKILFESGHPLVLCARNWAQDLLSAMPAHDFLPMQGQWYADCKTVRQHRLTQHQMTRPTGLLLPDSLTSALSFRLAGLACTGYRDDGRSLLLRWPIDKPVDDMHAVERWHYLTRTAMQKWDESPSQQRPSAQLGLPLSARHEQTARQALADAKLTAMPFILIAPTATGLHRGQVKVWPHFDCLTRALQDRGHTVIACPPSSETDAARIASPSATLLPALSLGAFAALTRHAALVICNDSGVSHLAASVGANQLTLFGVTSPERTGPWSSHAHTLGQEGEWPSLDSVLEYSLSLLATAAATATTSIHETSHA